jgi:DNA-binding NtrC family response regulator
VLSGAGAEVTTATSIEAMKSALADHSFDALIINGKMPGSTSVQETHGWIINSHPQLTGHFLFTFSSLAEPEVRSFLDQNSVRFLVKPFEVSDLISSTRRLLTKTKAAGAGNP